MINNKQLAIKFHNTIVGEGVQLYRNMYAKNSDKSARDISPFLQLYASSNQEQRECLLQQSRQVIVDTISHILGLIDGSSSWQGDQVQLRLTVLPDGIVIDGGLQDAFLAGR